MFRFPLNQFLLLLPFLRGMQEIGLIQFVLSNTWYGITRKTNYVI